MTQILFTGFAQFILRPHMAPNCSSSCTRTNSKIKTCCAKEANPTAVNAPCNEILAHSLLFYPIKYEATEEKKILHETSKRLQSVKHNLRKRGVKNGYLE